jgi:hypothetical protein
MPRPDPATLSFVRALSRSGEAKRSGESYVTPDGVALHAPAVAALIRHGAIAGDASRCHRNGATRNWLKRQLLDAEPNRDQHLETVSREGLTINMSESPVARLVIVTGRGGRPFLERHHVEAAEMLRRLVERAGMLPRVTTNYTHAEGSGTRGNQALDISDMAADARKKLARINAALPRDCAGVAIDVCGFLKGLQQVEAERGWPRRSAKLILRVALDCLAQHFGLDAAAVGPDSHRPHRWMGEGARPGRFE